MFEVVNTGIPKPSAPVNGTVRAGNMIYSVQVPRDTKTGQIVEGNMTVQMRQALSNLKQAVEAGGGTLKDVVQVIIYITDHEDFEEMNQVYTEFFSEPYPSRATLVVKRLIGPTTRVELVAHAHIS